MESLARYWWIIIQILGEIFFYHLHNPGPEGSGKNREAINLLCNIMMAVSVCDLVLKFSPLSTPQELLSSYVCSCIVASSSMYLLNNIWHNFVLEMV